MQVAREPPRGTSIHTRDQRLQGTGATFPRGPGSVRAADMPDFTGIFQNTSQVQGRSSPGPLRNSPGMGSGRGMDVRRSPDSTEALADISLGKEGGRSPSRAEPPAGTSAQPPMQLSRRLTGKCQDTGPGPSTGASRALVRVWPGCVRLWDRHLRPQVATQRPTLFHHPKCLRPACWIPPSLGETKP